MEMKASKTGLLVCVVSGAFLAAEAYGFYRDVVGGSSRGGVVDRYVADITGSPDLTMWNDPGLIVSSPDTPLQPVCTDFTGCGIISRDDCKWHPIRTAMIAQGTDPNACVNLLPAPPYDVVDQALCEHGILLDGVLDDALDGGECVPGPEEGADYIRDLEAKRAIAMIDEVWNLGIFDPGDDGHDEPPRLPADPSGFNIACSLLWFQKDSNPDDEVDDSFLYVAWDIADLADVDGVAPSQFDSDDDGSACFSAEPVAAPLWEFDDEQYEVHLQSCAELMEFKAEERATNNINAIRDAIVFMNIAEDEGISLGIGVPEGEVWLDVIAFPTSDSTTNLRNTCIDKEVEQCVDAMRDYTPPSPPAEDTNNVEMVIKRVETSGLFGPNQRECTNSHTPCRRDVDCPGGETCISTIDVSTSDGKEAARQNRFALAQLVALLTADTDIDESEEYAVVALHTSLPSIGVTKKGRCEEDLTLWPYTENNPENPWRENVGALPGSFIEFMITIKNAGNEDLEVSVEDVMEAVGSQQEYVRCGGPICATMEAYLTSPRRGLVDLKLPDTPPEVVGLEPDFFVDACDELDDGFLGSIRNERAEPLGKLLGAQVARNAEGVCEFTDGDTLVIYFRAKVNVTNEDDFCAAYDNPDCVNTVTVTGDPDSPPEPDGDEVTDTDDTAVDLRCRDITFIKEVKEAKNKDGGLLNPPNRLPVVDPTQFPVKLTYGYTVTNTGEIAEDVEITDEQLCGDIAELAALGEQIWHENCPVCDDGDPSNKKENLPNTPPDNVFLTECTVAFGDADALIALLERDDGRGQVCVGGEADGEACEQDEQCPGGVCDCAGNPNESCYRNCGIVEVDAHDLPPGCDRTDKWSSRAEICGGGCLVQVAKQVKCEDDPEDKCEGGLRDGEPCVRDEHCPGGMCKSYYKDKKETFAKSDTPESEDVTFRVMIENTGPTAIPQLCIEDVLSCPEWFPYAGKSFSVKEALVFAVDGSTTVVTDSMRDFSIDGVVHCFVPEEDNTGVASPIGPEEDPPGIGEILTITFDLPVPDQSRFTVPTEEVDCENCVEFVKAYTEVAPEPDLEEPDCEDGPACAEVDVKVPDVACEKLVCADFNCNRTCDTPWTDGLSLDRSEISEEFCLIYKFTAINPYQTSETALKNVEITDEYFVADFVAAGMPIFADTCLFCSEDINVCDNNDDTKARLPNLPVPPLGGPSPSVSFECWVKEVTAEKWSEAFDGCYENTAAVSGEPDGVAEDICGRYPVESDCTAEVCFQPPCTCTKAKFDVWNQNEVKFSGSDRCICHWDQAFISEYDPPNHMLREFMGTDKGKARITGVRSTTHCGEDSRDAPLLGLAAKRLTFETGDAVAAGMPLVGVGVDPDRYGQILYDPSDADPPPPELGGAPAGYGSGVTRIPGRSAASDPLAATSALPEEPAVVGQKGSFLVYPKVELKWDAAGNLIQDTFLTLANDFGLPAGESMIVQLYFVRSCNAWVDATIKLTGDEPTYWSAFTGNPKGVQPFTALSDGIEDDTDPRNPGGKRLRGYVLVWAINNDGLEINWNHLTGSAMIINYLDANAWEYETWAFRAVDADLANGETLREPLGQLDLNGIEYEAPPARLLLDFYATGTTLWSHDEMTGQVSPSFFVDTDLTLWPPIKDLRK